MNCQEAKDLIKLFLNGDLDHSTMQRVRGHLGTCRECASEMNPLDLMEILPVLDDSIEPSEDLTYRFYAALEAGRDRDTIPERSTAYGMKRLWLPRWSWSLAAAAMLTIVVSTGLYLRQYRSDTPEVGEVYYDLEVTENLPLLMDMALISNLELFENMDAIENMPQ